MGAKVIALKPKFERFTIVKQPTDKYEKEWLDNYSEYWIRSAFYSQVKKAFLSWRLRYEGIELNMYKTNFTASYSNDVFFKNFAPYRMDHMPKTVCEDAFSWFDRKYKTTLALLEMSDTPLMIRTRSDLIAHDQYLEHIPKWSTINLYYSNDNGFPSTKRLQRAADKITQERPDIKISLLRYRG